MAMHSPWLILALVIAAAVTGRIVVLRRRQLHQLNLIARRQKLHFSTLDLIGLHERYYNLDLIRRGHGRHASNVLYGSRDEGLVALFCYSYDLGFGVYQTPRRWWIAVVETPEMHDHWSARPAKSTANESPEEKTAAGGSIGPFLFRADHEATMQRLSAPDPARFFKQASPDYHWETRGPLIAVATPLTTGTETPENVLTAACELAKHLQTSATQPSDRTTEGRADQSPR